MLKIEKTYEFKLINQTIIKVRMICQAAAKLTVMDKEMATHTLENFKQNISIKRSTICLKLMALFLVKTFIYVQKQWVGGHNPKVRYLLLILLSLHLV